MMLPSLTTSRKEALREMAVPWIPIAILLAIVQLLESNSKLHEGWLVVWGLPCAVSIAYVATVANGLKRYCGSNIFQTYLGKLFALFYVLATLGTPVVFLLEFMRFELPNFEMAAIIGFFLTFLLHAYLAGVNRLVSSRVKDRELWKNKKFAQIDFVYGPVILPLLLTPFILTAPFLDRRISYPWLYFAIVFLGTVVLHFLSKSRVEITNGY